MSKGRNTIQLNINTTHYIAGTNRFRYVLPAPMDLTKNNPTVAISHYAVYNSTYNISSALGNNKYSIKWVDGTTKEFVIDDGYYSFSDLNLNLQYNMASEKWFLQNTTTSSQAYYFIACQANNIQYKSEIDIFYVPSTMPSGYAIPSGATWTLPAQPTYPQITLSAGLQSIFGITSQSVMPDSQTIQTTATGVPKNLTYLSNTYPVLSPVFVYVVGCNLISNSVNANPTIFAQIPLTASYGEMITQTFSVSKMLTVSKGKYTFIELTLYDQNLTPLVLVDPEISLSLMLEFDEM